MAAPLISPSILSADFARLGEEIARSTPRGRLDPCRCDGRAFRAQHHHRPGVVKALRPHTRKPFDVHLMIAPVDPYLEAFADAGADIITVHPEAGPHATARCRRSSALGKKAGISLNPARPPRCSTT
jgi:ribulose-phosphate 3-epimerase